MSAEWSWELLRAGAFRLDGGSMFGIVPKILWSRLMRPDEQNRIQLQTNCLLLDNGAHKVLIETGYGGKWDAKDRKMFHLEPRTVLDALQEAGVAPAEIDLVIVTHLHFDHAGGLTHIGDDGQPISSFPNASVVSQCTEWADALANRSTMRKSYLPSHLEPVADQMRLLDGEEEILPGLLVRPNPGHTWGHQAVQFRDGEGTVCFPGDLMPTAHHVGLAYNMAYDVLPHTNSRTKVELLERAAREDWRLVIDHEPGDPVVRVRRGGNRPDQFILVPDA